MIFTQGQFIDFIETVFGKGILSNGGKNISVVCPVCTREKGAQYNKKKLVIRTDNGINHCWVCSYKSRNLLALIKITNPEFLEEYKTTFNNIATNSRCFILDVNDTETISTDFEDILFLPKRTMFLADNYKTYHGNKYFNYLKKRGITEIEDLWYWKFLYTVFDEDYKDRIIIPSFDSMGTLNYFTARSLFDGPYVKRYKNPIKTRESIIFNDININWQKPLTLVEGPFDLVKCNQNATCLLGSVINIKYELFQNIIINNTPIILGLDEDATNKAIKIAENLLRYDIDVSMITPPTNKDVGDLSKEEFNELYQQTHVLTKKDLLLYKIRNIQL